MKKKMIFGVVVLLLGLSMIAFGCFITFSNKKEKITSIEKTKENQESELTVDPLKLTEREYSDESVIASSIVSLFPDYYATNKENLKTSIPYQEINSNFKNGNVTINPNYYYFDSTYQKGSDKTNVYYGIMPNTKDSIYGYNVDDTLENGFLLNMDYDDDSKQKIFRTQVQKFDKDAKLLWETSFDFRDLLLSDHLEEMYSYYYGSTELDDGGVVLIYYLELSYDTGQLYEDGEKELDTYEKIALVTINGMGQVLKRDVLDDYYIHSGGIVKKNKENIIVYDDDNSENGTTTKVATVTKDGTLKVLFEQNEFYDYYDVFYNDNNYIGVEEEEEEDFKIKTVYILDAIGKRVDQFSFSDVIGTKNLFVYNYCFLGKDTLVFMGEEYENEEENDFYSYVYFLSMSKKKVIKKIKLEKNFSIEKRNIDPNNNLSLLLCNYEDEKYEDTVIRMMFDQNGNKIDENRMEYFEDFDTEIHFVKGNILSLSNIYLDGVKNGLLTFYKLKEE